MTASLSARERRRAFGRLLLLQSCWSYEGMQGLGLAYAMEPWLRRLYGGEGRRELLRYDCCFNTHPFLAPLEVGMLYGLEEEAARASAAQREQALKRLAALKTAASCALAGVGDAFFWGALRPASAALALLCGLAAWRLNVPGAVWIMVLVYLAAYDVPALWVRWNGLRWGYQWRADIAHKVKSLRGQRWIRACRAAAAVLGLALLALTFFAAPTRWVRGLGLGATAVYLLAARLFPGLTPARVYAAVCAAGIAAAAAGWLR